MIPVHVIIPAAGSGSRIGADLPKLLLPLAGVPIIVRTVRSVLQCADVTDVIVTAPAGYEGHYRNLLQKEKVQVVTGGASRTESVFIALQHLAKNIKDPEKELVMVHDGARCFISLDIIERSLAAASEKKAVTVAVPVIDSIKKVIDTAQVVESLDRSTLVAVQTPQVFTFNLLMRAHLKQQESGSPATDDASLVESIHPVFTVEGDRKNFKVTTPFDLQIAEFLAAPNK
ncbi:MAG: 2-C-methyl-D-erythritol 4-phosphate cytidylyltransferase [Bdellovibrionota bacterium]|jgi:2-C-methyl-D-erythritol 4-phosphate cytidylyltransferase